MINEIEVNLSQEKISFINDSYQKEVKKVSAENEAKGLIDLAPSTVFKIFKAAIKNGKKMNIDKIKFYLKSRYSTDNKNQITFIQDIPSQEDVHFLEVISDYLKTFSKSMKEDENMSLKNKVLFVACISIAAKAYRNGKIVKKKDVLHRFEDSKYIECKIKKANSS